jgi:hypothetical protein
MAASEQETQQGVHYEENNHQDQETELGDAQEYPVTEETANQEEHKKNVSSKSADDKGSFVHGLSVGLGLGCIATFVIMWIAVFFTPKLPPSITYENLLVIFIFPLIYMLAVGLVALTAGIVRQYYTHGHKL